MRMLCGATWRRRPCTKVWMPCLVARIDRLPVQRGVAGDRARHDDVAGAALDHAGEHGADGAEDAGEVDRDHLLPGVGVAVLDVAGDVEAGVGEEDVDPAEAVEGGGTMRSTSAGRVRSTGRSARRRRRSRRGWPRAARRSGRRARGRRLRGRGPRRARGRCRSSRR